MPNINAIKLAVNEMDKILKGLKGQLKIEYPGKVDKAEMNKHPMSKEKMKMESENGDKNEKY